MARPATARPVIDQDEVPRIGGALAAVDEGDEVEARMYRTLFESVMNQRLTPGTKLPEAALCELFGTTRSVVRKVLQRLAHDHIVQLRPNRGAIIAVPTPEETRQVFEARRGLEGVIVNLATLNATAADVTQLRRLLAEEHEAMHQLAQPAWARLASSFHLQLAALARNAILERYLVEMVSRCSLIVALHEPPGNASCEHEEHEAIVRCIERGDAAGAVQLMDAHLRQLERNVSVERRDADRSLAHLLGMN